MQPLEFVVEGIVDQLLPLSSKCFLGARRLELLYFLPVTFNVAFLYHLLFVVYLDCINLDCIFLLLVDLRLVLKLIVFFLGHLTLTM